MLDFLKDYIGDILIERGYLAEPKLLPDGGYYWLELHHAKHNAGYSMQIQSGLYITLVDGGLLMMYDSSDPISPHVRDHAREKTWIDLPKNGSIDQVTETIKIWDEMIIKMLRQKRDDLRRRNIDLTFRRYKMEGKSI